MNKRKIAVIVVDRANYGRLKPVMEEMRERQDVQMQTVCAGTMVLERFGQPVKVVRSDGFEVDSEVYIELEGSTPTTMAKSLGFAIIEFSSEFQRLKPDIILLIGDRYEMLAAAIAASYMNICIAHIQGGEVSGSIDEVARHCITKLAHFHFPATKRAVEYLIRMGEDPAKVFYAGCPSGDIALKITKTLPKNIFDRGIGGKVNPQNPYLLVVFHPITTEYGKEKDETVAMLDALAELNHPTVWLWPNIDAGADHISKVIRSYRERNEAGWLRLVKNFPPEDYLKVLSNAACAVGNSSSFVRDSSFLGTPVVLVGDRQQGRESSENVLSVPVECKAILDSIKKQLGHGPYRPSNLYGDGTASRKIADMLARVKPYVQKRLAYE